LLDVVEVLLRPVELGVNSAKPLAHGLTSPSMADKRKQTQPTPKGHEIGTPSKEEFDRFVKKVAGPGSRKRPDEKRQPPQRSE
jgi:hypothetical protein